MTITSTSTNTPTSLLSSSPSYSLPDWPHRGDGLSSADKHDLAYGFEPIDSGPRPYGHFPSSSSPSSSSSSSSSSSTDEEDLNRGNSHDVQETSKKASFADPPSEVEHSYKSSSSSKSNIDLATVSTESIPDIAISNGSPKSRGYSSPMPDVQEDSNRDRSNSGGFKPFFMDKNSPAGGPRKYSTVAPPILEIEAADNSGKVDHPISMTTSSSIGPAYSTSLTPAYSPPTSASSSPSSPSSSAFSPSTSSSSSSSPSQSSASFTPSYLPSVSTTTPLPTSVPTSQPSTISSPPRSKYHSLDDGNDLKPLTKITVQPIDLNYLNSNRHKGSKGSSQKNAQRLTPLTSSAYYSRPLTTTMDKDAYSNKVIGNIAGKSNNGLTNSLNSKSRVNKPTKYSTYSLFGDNVQRPTSAHLSQSTNVSPGQLSASISSISSVPTVSSAFLESQAAKFAQMAKLNLEKSNSHRDPFWCPIARNHLDLFKDLESGHFEHIYR